MTRVIKIFLVAALVGAWLSLAAGAQVAIPFPPDVPPQWAPVPQAGGVQYAPNLNLDLFRYKGRHYCYYNGLWYRGSATAGPWVQINAVPQVFYQVTPVYFKTPPGWAKGKKTGWRGQPLPPGQMKKYEGGSLPPGQMKKMSR